MRKISIVIPVYNNEGSLYETFIRIQKTFIKLSCPVLYEVIFINDGSRDASWNEILRIKDLHPENIYAVKLSRNFGQLYAILAGYELATGDAVITISADLQDPISLMPEMIDRWISGDEIVIAHRNARDDDVAATLFSKIAYGLARKANPKIPSGGFDYLLMSRRAVDILKKFKGRHRFFQGDVLWIGLRTSFIPYAREKRPVGKSGWSVSRKIKYFIDLLIDSSYFPIRAMSVLGMVTACLGFLYALVIVYAWSIQGTPFQGWAPLMIATLVIGGCIMFMLGIIGEYVWRMYEDIKIKPLFIIEESISPGDKTHD